MNGFYNISCGDMSLDDYKMLCDAIIHMSCDIESNVDYPWNDEASKEIYAYVKYMIDCINDVPKSRVEYAVEDMGVKLPEIEL